MDSVTAQADTPFLSRLRESVAVSKNEISETSPLQKAAVGAAVMGVVYEWSPANEYLNGLVSSDVFEAGRQSEHLTGALINSLETGASVGMIAGATQLVVGVLAAAAVRSMPETFGALSNKSLTYDTVNNNPSISTTLALGTSAAVVEANYRNPNRGFKDDFALVAKASGIVVAANVALGTVIGTVGSVLDRSNHGNITDTLIDIARNPFTYISIFAAAKTHAYFKNKREKNNYSNS